jgi:site-specific recombinase XerD
MTTPTGSRVTRYVPEVGTLAESIDEWRVTLRAENKAPATRTVYVTAAKRLNGFLRGAGMPVKLSAIRAEHIEAFLVALQDEGRSSATVSVYYRSLQSFWKWAVRRGEVTTSPMGSMSPPIVPPKPVKPLSDAERDALLEAVSGKSYEDIRDNAILRLFMDTGARRQELAGLRVEDVTFDNSDKGDHYVTVQGKGRKERSPAFTDSTYIALRRYLKARNGTATQPPHPRSEGTDALWIGYRGPLTANGILQMMERRAKQAGVTGVHPHLFRHSAATEWLAAGGSESGLMANMGWKSAAMLRRYTAATAEVRAREESRRLKAGKR